VSSFEPSWPPGDSCRTRRKLKLSHEESPGGQSPISDSRPGLGDQRPLFLSRADSSGPTSARDRGLEPRRSRQLCPRRKIENAAAREGANTWKESMDFKPIECYPAAFGPRDSTRARSWLESRWKSCHGGIDRPRREARFNFSSDVEISQRAFLSVRHVGQSLGELSRLNEWILNGNEKPTTRSKSDRPKSRSSLEPESSRSMIFPNAMSP